MTNLELTKRASEIVAQFRDETISDEQIIRQIKEEPELIHVKCLSGANLFLDAVRWDRFSIAKVLREMGADIHWTCEASMIHGNALVWLGLPSRQISFLNGALKSNGTCRS